MPNKNEKIDALVLLSITNIPKRFSAIYIGSVEEECCRIAHAEIGKEAFRILDRRLQALRKAGKIKSTPQGWVRVSQ